MLFFDRRRSSTLSCDFRVHGAGSQLKSFISLEIRIRVFCNDLAFLGMGVPLKGSNKFLFFKKRGEEESIECNPGPRLDHPDPAASVSAAPRFATVSRDLSALLLAPIDRTPVSRVAPLWSKLF